jgi:hypothetical protein
VFIYDEQSHNFSFVPGFRLLPLIPFHFRKFSIVIPGYFLEIVQSESPSLTVCTFEASELLVAVTWFELLGWTEETCVIGFLGKMVRRCPILRLLLLSPFHRLIWLTPTPYLSAIFPR